MRFILPLAEQLDRAAAELSAARPLSSRMALILGSGLIARIAL